MADDVRPLGAALAAARRERGLSVEDVSAATRIRPAIVRAIEADDFDACGGAAYARGHLRSIAQLVGADPRPLVEEFDRRFHQPVPALRTAPLGSFEPPRDAGRSGRQSPPLGVGGGRRAGRRRAVPRRELARRPRHGRTAPPVPRSRPRPPAATTTAPRAEPDHAAAAAAGLPGRGAAAAGQRRAELGLGALQRRHGDLPGRAHRRAWPRSSATTPSCRCGSATRSRSGSPRTARTSARRSASGTSARVAFGLPSAG